MRRRRSRRSAASTGTRSRASCAPSAAPSTTPPRRSPRSARGDVAHSGGPSASRRCRGTPSSGSLRLALATSMGPSRDPKLAAAAARALERAAEDAPSQPEIRGGPIGALSLPRASSRRGDSPPGRHSSGLQVDSGCGLTRSRGVLRAVGANDEALTIVTTARAEVGDDHVAVATELGATLEARGGGGRGAHDLARGASNGTRFTPAHTGHSRSRPCRRATGRSRSGSSTPRSTPRARPSRCSAGRSSSHSGPKPGACLVLRASPRSASASSKRTRATSARRFTWRGRPWRAARRRRPRPSPRRSSASSPGTLVASEAQLVRYTADDPEPRRPGAQAAGDVDRPPRRRRSLKPSTRAARSESEGSGSRWLVVGRAERRRGRLRPAHAALAAAIALAPEAPPRRITIWSTSSRSSGDPRKPWRTRGASSISRASLRGRWRASSPGQSATSRPRPRRRRARRALGPSVSARLGARSPGAVIGAKDDPRRDHVLGTNGPARHAAQSATIHRGSWRRSNPSSPSDAGRASGRCSGAAWPAWQSRSTALTTRHQRRRHRPFVRRVRRADDSRGGAEDRPLRGRSVGVQGRREVGRHHAPPRARRSSSRGRPRRDAPRRHPPRRRARAAQSDLASMPRLALVLRATSNRGSTKRSWPPAPRACGCRCRGFVESLNVSVTAALLLTAATEGRPRRSLRRGAAAALRARPLPLRFPTPKISSRRQTFA